jgi:hypothetical protein
MFAKRAVSPVLSDSCGFQLPPPIPLQVDGKYSITGAPNLDGDFTGVTVSVTNTAIDVFPDAVDFTLKAAKFDSNTFIVLKRGSATMQICISHFLLDVDHPI